MAKLIPYDVEGVEESGGTGVKPPLGVRVARIDLAEQRTKRKDGQPANDIRLGLNFGPEYDWLFEYVGLDIDWKLAEFIRALGLGDKGKIDLDKHAKGKFVRVKIDPDTYNGGPSVQVGRLMKAQPGDDKKWGESVSELSSQAGTGDDGPEEDDAETGTKTYENPEFVASREGEEGVGSYEDWPDEDLEAEVGDRGVTLPGGRASKRNKMIKALRDEDAEVTGADDAEPDENQDQVEASQDGADDYDTWDLDQLKKEWSDRDLGDMPSIRGRNAEERLKTALVEAIRKDDEENPFTP